MTLGLPTPPSSSAVPAVLPAPHAPHLLLSVLPGANANDSACGSLTNSGTMQADAPPALNALLQQLQLPVPLPGAPVPLPDLQAAASVPPTRAASARPSRAASDPRPASSYNARHQQVKRGRCTRAARSRRSRRLVHAAASAWPAPAPLLAVTSGAP